MEPVDIVALDDYAAGHHLPRIAVMKIDVEGFEVAVIEGAARVLERDRPALVIEVFARALQTVGTSVPRLELALAAHDYLFFAIEDDGSLEEIASLVERDGDNVVVVPRERLSLTAAMRVVRL